MNSDDEGKSFDERETQALLEILALGKKQVAEGRTHSLEEVIEELRRRRARRGAASQPAP
jgi:hypothetical protein